MSVPAGYRRVTRRSPCGICEKPDWCLVAIDGSSYICSRVQSSTRAGNAGFVHSGDSAPVDYRNLKPQAPIIIDAAAICHAHQKAMCSIETVSISETLGVSTESLTYVGVGRAVGWLPGTHSFPMRGEDGRIIGLRLRNVEGQKWAITGSRNGLFFDPGGLLAARTVYLCEGPTDQAALFDLGVYPVGRFSNSGGIDMLRSLLSRTKPDVVIVSENDGRDDCKFCEHNYCLACQPGKVGADMVAAGLWGRVKSIKIIDPLKGKDVRAWKQHGATAQTLAAVVSNTPPLSTPPKI